MGKNLQNVNETAFYEGKNQIIKGDPQFTGLDFNSFQLSPRGI
jgi:hypothetical protein